MGWDPNNLDPDLQKLLSQAGIGEDEMRDEKTSQLIYNVIEQSGGMEAVKREVNRGQTRKASPRPPGRVTLLRRNPVFCFFLAISIFFLRMFYLKTSFC